MEYKLLTYLASPSKILQKSENMHNKLAKFKSHLNCKGKAIMGTYDDLIQFVFFQLWAVLVPL